MKIPSDIIVLFFCRLLEREGLNLPAKQSGRVSTSPPSRAGGSQPPRLAEREALIPRRGGGSQPPRRGGESQPPRQCGGSQPPRQGGGSQPPRQGGSFQPPRQGGSFQPPRRGGGSQPPRQCGGSQPPHQGGGSQPPREGGGPYPPSKAELEGFNPPVKMEKNKLFYQNNFLSVCCWLYNKHIF